MTDAGHRLWRLRKQYQSIDAALTVEGSAAGRHSDSIGLGGAAGGSAMDAGGSGVGSGPGVVLQFLLSGEVVYTRRWPTRELAMEDATARRSALEREGWMPHW
jgi:hypothetical protein